MLWNIDTAMMAVLFIGVGALLKKYRLLEYRKILLPVVLLMPTAFMAVKHNPVGLVSFNANRYGNMLLMLAGALPLATGVMLAAKALCSFFSCRYLEFLGRHTIFIMGFDYFSGSVSKVILEKMGQLSWVTEFLLKIVILTIGIVTWNALVKRISNKRVPKILNY